ncbi:MAG: prepilin-type N-terminal cleavage/methylation domain-containing protein [Candidatus Kaiserbacteria bacterium]|nr:prepilin-type N-terminal cleavage/methylation domain-containing protein [Candidatus Kaiserbacteria bacterium]
MLKRNKGVKGKGFTLIELLIVIAIIGALAAIVIVSLTGSTEDARKSVVQVNLGQIDRLITTMVSVDRVKLKDVCNLLNNPNEEQKGIKKVLDAVVVAGETISPITEITNGGKVYADVGDHVQSIGAGSTIRNRGTAGGCISSPNGGGSWVIWYTPTGTQKTYCIDSGSSEVREITIGTDRYRDFVTTGRTNVASCSVLD